MSVGSEVMARGRTRLKAGLINRLLLAYCACIRFDGL